MVNFTFTTEWSYVECAGSSCIVCEMLTVGSLEPKSYTENTVVYSLILQHVLLSDLLQIEYSAFPLCFHLQSALDLCFLVNIIVFVYVV